MATTATERKLLVAGEWVETGDWVEVRSPYSGEVVARVAKAGAAETKRAIDSAEQALREPLPAHKRAEILVKVVAGIARRHDEIARQISDEAGKPLKAARVETSRAMSTYTFAAVEARKLAGEVVPMDAAQAGEGKLAFTLRRPIGIVGAISPFNFPLNLVAHKLAPALAAGCPVVLKPASQTPLSALLLAELEDEAGLPPGWLSVVVGPSSEIGDVLVEDERVHGLGRRRLGPEGARPAQEGEPRARQRDARDRHRRRGRRRRGRGDGRERLRLCGAELHLRAAGLRRARRLCGLRRGHAPSGAGAEAR
jgi:acyl-CoA reductase-like NAD-dependent aldehyde dehydrogenase